MHTGQGCTAHAHAHTHLLMHLHMHPSMHLHTSHGCSRRRSWRCSWPAARGGGVAHVVAGWSTVGPPRELRCAACGKHFGAPSPGTGGPLPTGGGVTKVARSAPRCLPGSHAWVGVRSKSAASVVCVRAACCRSICPSGCRSAGWPPGAAARGAASRARGTSGAAGRGRGTTRPSTSGGAHQAAAPHGLSPEAGAAQAGLSRAERGTAAACGCGAVRDGRSCLWPAYPRRCNDVTAAGAARGATGAAGGRFGDCEWLLAPMTCCVQDNV